MKFFLDFLHQKVPRDRGEIPAYYSRALTAGEILQAVYFLVCFFLYPLINSRWEWIPMIFIVATGLCLWAVKGNERAIRFYEKNGFRLNGEEKFVSSISAGGVKMIKER